MTKFSMCIKSFRSIDNQLAKLSRGVDTAPPPPHPEREGVEKYHLRERVQALFSTSSKFWYFCELTSSTPPYNVCSFDWNP